MKADAFRDGAPVLLEELRMEFGIGGHAFTVLDIPQYRVEGGSATAIVGASGSGKTTLLHIITGLTTPTAGRVVVDDVAIEPLSGAKKDRFRGERVGYVLQTFNLLRPLTALENVLLPMVFARRIPRREQKRRAMELLERVKLGHRIRHRPLQLSHGEQQRVGIARALANRPKLVVADEPTASLEPGSGEAVIALLVEACKQEGATLIVATHDQSLLRFMDRVDEMQKLNRALGGRS